VIRAYTELHSDMERLSPADRIETQKDLLMFGLFVLDKSDSVRRIDPREVEFRHGEWRISAPQTSAIDRFMRKDPYLSTLVDWRVRHIETIAVSHGSKAGKKTLWHYLTQEAFGARLRYNDESLSIWRKHDPGAV
jgi:hypothetical protein